MSPTRQALEDFLAANPDDLAAHSAYADWLTENNDPHGEYIRLELSLEDGDQTADQIQVIEKTSDQLRKMHEAVWLGSFNEFVNPRRWQLRSSELPVDRHLVVNFRRGWIHEVQITNPTERFWELLLACPLSRLLQILKLIAPAEIYVHDTSGWLKSITKFPVMNHLTINCDQFADASVDQLLESGIVNQLQYLNLDQCGITDDGAQALANDPAVRKLGSLQLELNYISPIGSEALQKIGVKVGEQMLPYQHGPARNED